MLNAVHVPAGVDDARGPRRPARTGSASKSAAASAQFKGKVWRIGLMGYGARPANVLLFLSRAGTIASRAAMPCPPLRSIAAANAALSGTP